MKELIVTRPNFCVFNKLLCEEDGIYKPICGLAFEMFDEPDNWIVCSNGESNKNGKLVIPANCPLLKNEKIQITSDFLSTKSLDSDAPLCEIEK